MNFQTNQFEVRDIKEILPEDIINIDTSISLAPGSSSEFTFSGFANVPILISTEGVAHDVEIFDSTIE